MKYSATSIDLQAFNTYEDMQDFFKKLNYPYDDEDLQEIWKHKMGKSNIGEKVIKLWVDSVTFNTFAYETIKGAKFFSEYGEYLSHLTPISPYYVENKKEKVSNFDKLLTLDGVLDKINQTGINSLSEDELNILENLSK